MTHNKTNITETMIEDLEIDNDKLLFIVPWCTDKEKEKIDLCKVPEYIIKEIRNGLSRTMVNIRLDPDNVLLEVIKFC